VCELPVCVCVCVCWGLHSSLIQSWGVGVGLLCDTNIIKHQLQSFSLVLLTHTNWYFYSCEDPEFNRYRRNSTSDTRGDNLRCLLIRCPENRWCHMRDYEFCFKKREELKETTRVWERPSYLFPGSSKTTRTHTSAPDDPTHTHRPVLHAADTTSSRSERTREAPPPLVFLSLRQSPNGSGGLLSARWLNFNV